MFCCRKGTWEENGRWALMGSKGRSGIIGFDYICLSEQDRLNMKLELFWRCHDVKLERCKEWHLIWARCYKYGCMECGVVGTFTRKKTCSYHGFLCTCQFVVYISVHPDSFILYFVLYCIYIGDIKNLVTRCKNLWAASLYQELWSITVLQI